LNTAKHVSLLHQIFFVSTLNNSMPKDNRFGRTVRGTANIVILGNLISILHRLYQTIDPLLSSSKKILTEHCKKELCKLCSELFSQHACVWKVRVSNEGIGCNAGSCRCVRDRVVSAVWSEFLRDGHRVLN